VDQELLQYLDERFGRIEQRLDSHDLRFNTIDQRFDGIEQRLDTHDERFRSIDQRFEQVNERIDDRFEEVKRHTGVLVEGLHHEVRLVAEGFATFVESRYAQDQANIAQQFRETRGLIHSVYAELKQQNAQLQQRVERLEQKGQA
jgi:archaellum component FlaC